MCAHTSVALRYYNYVYFNYQFKSEKKKCGVGPNIVTDKYTLRCFQKLIMRIGPTLYILKFSLWRDLRKEVTYSDIRRLFCKKLLPPQFKK